MAFNNGYSQFPTYTNNTTLQAGQLQMVNIGGGGGGSYSGGYSGNPSLNLQEVTEVQEVLRERRTKKMGVPNSARQQQVNPNTDFFSITDANEERLFKPLLPANKYVHEDDHLEWLYGRTRSVCSRLKWAKTTFSQ